MPKDKVDSLERKQSSFQSKVQHKFDSLNNLALKQKFTDSLSVLAWGDSVKNKLNSSAAGDIQKLNNRIDSLQSLNLPTDKLKHKIDSINNRKEQLVGAVNNKQQELLGKSEQRVKDWQEKLKASSV